MSNEPHQESQWDGNAQQPFYQPPTDYAFGGGVSLTPYLDSIPESAGFEPYQGPASAYSYYPEPPSRSYTVGTKRQWGCMDETDETDETAGEENETMQIQVRTKQPRRTLARRKAESNLSKKKKELEKIYGVGNITNDNKVRGSVVMHGNQMKWYDIKQRKYHPCVYHDDIREDLIRIAKDIYPDYQVAPEKGLHPLDITSNCSVLSQHTWSATTAEDRAQICDADGLQVMMLQDRPKQSEPDLPGVWRFRGCLVLDQESHPILDWTQLPHTLSSKLEGWRIEALRRTIPGLEASQLRARMPRSITVGNVKAKTIYGFSTLRHRASRFRDEHQMGAWDERIGTAQKKQRYSESQSTSLVSTPRLRSRSETVFSSTPPVTRPPTGLRQSYSMTDQHFAEQLSQGLRNLDSETYLSSPATLSESRPATAPNEQMQVLVENAPEDEADPDTAADHLSQDADFRLSSSDYREMALEFGNDIKGLGADSWNYDETYLSPPATISESRPVTATNEQIQGLVENAPQDEADPDTRTGHLSQDGEFDLFSSNFQASDFDPSPSDFHNMALQLGGDVSNFGADSWNYNETYSSLTATNSESRPATVPNDRMQGLTENAPAEEAALDTTALHLNQDADFDLYSSNLQATDFNPSFSNFQAADYDPSSSNFHDMALELGDDVNGFGADLWNYDL